MIMANYDQSGLRFPIQKLILGPRALKMFGSQENNRLVTHILSEKLYEYLSNTKISLEVNDGEAILDARMPPLSIVDRCDISLKERFKLSVNQSNVTFSYLGLGLRIHTVRNLHFLSKNSTLISQENCRFFLG